MNKPALLKTESIYYPILAIIGVPANLVAILILSSGKCGLTRCVIQYLKSMAVADLMVLIVSIILYEIKEAYFPRSFLSYTPICNVVFALIYISLDWSVWLTVTFTFDRFVAICHQSLRSKYCTMKTALKVITAVFLLSILENIPIYFMFEPREVINDEPWSCYIKSSFYTSLTWIAYLWFITLLTPFAPFVLILLLNTLTTKHIIMANRVRSKLRGSNREACQTDQETENRRKSIILLVAISGNFIFLWTVNLVCFICIQFTDTEFLETDYNDPFTIAHRSGYMLRYLSTCTNTFIYAVSQRHFREELKNVISRPFLAIANIFKR